MTSHGPRAHREKARPAYTLVETALAVTASGLLAVAMVSSVALSTRSLSVVSSATNHTAMNESLTDLMSELRMATSVAKTATSLTVTVPDRTGDGAADTIAYTWSASAGSPVTRSINGGTAVAVTDNVDSVSIESWGDVDLPSTPSPIAVVASIHTDSTSTANESISTLSLRGQYFLPNVPASAQSWTPNKIMIQGRNTTGATGTISVEIQTVSTPGYPTGTILVGNTVDVSTWGSSYGWRTVNLSNGPTLPPTQPLCIVVKKVTATSTVQIQSNAAAGANDMLSSSLGGITWSRSSTKALQHQVEGTYIGQQVNSGITYLHWLQASITRSIEPNSKMVVSVNLLNRPAGTGFP